MNLGKVEFEKKLAVKDGQAFAVVEETGNFEKIKGCEFFRELKNRDAEINGEITELQARMTELEFERELNRSQMLDLERAGYCPLDETNYNRFGGEVINKKLGHRRNCQHKGE